MLNVLNASNQMDLLFPYSVPIPNLPMYGEYAGNEYAGWSLVYDAGPNHLYKIKKVEFPAAVAWYDNNGTTRQVHVMATRSSWITPVLYELDPDNLTSLTISDRGDPIRPWAWIDSNDTIHVLYQSADRIWHAWRYSGSNKWLTYRWPDKGIFPSGGEFANGSSYILYYWKEWLYLNGLRLWQVWPADKTTGYPAVSAYVDGRLIIAYLNHTNGDMFVATIYPEESAFFGGLFGEQIHRNLSASTGSVANLMSLGIDNSRGLAVLAWIDRRDERVWTAYENMTGVWNVSRIDNLPILDSGNPAANFIWSNIRCLEVGSLWDQICVHVAQTREAGAVGGPGAVVVGYNRKFSSPGGAIYNNATWPQRWDLEVTYRHYGQPYTYLRLVTYLNGVAQDYYRNVSMTQYVNQTTYFIFTEVGTHNITMEGSYHPYGPWETCFWGNVVITPNIVIGQVLPTKPYFLLSEDITLRYYKQNLPADQDWWITIYEPVDAQLVSQNGTWTYPETFYDYASSYQVVASIPIHNHYPNQTWQLYRLPRFELLGCKRWPLVCAFESSNKRQYNFTTGNAMFYSKFSFYYDGIKAPISWTVVNGTDNSSWGLKLRVDMSGLDFSVWIDRCTCPEKPPDVVKYWTGYPHQVITKSGFLWPGIQPYYYVYLKDSSWVNVDALLLGDTSEVSKWVTQGETYTYANYVFHVSENEWIFYDLPPGTYFACVAAVAVQYKLKTPWDTKLPTTQGRVNWDDWEMVQFPDYLNTSHYVYSIPAADISVGYDWAHMQQDAAGQTGIAVSSLLGLAIVGAVCISPMMYVRSALPCMLMCGAVAIVILSGSNFIPGSSVYFVIVPLSLGVAIIVANIFGKGRGGGPGV